MSCDQGIADDLQQANKSKIQETIFIEIPALAPSDEPANLTRVIENMARRPGGITPAHRARALP